MATALSYYCRCEGVWVCRLDFRVSNWRAFWQQPMPAIERLQVLTTALLPKVLGALTLRTSVFVRSEVHVVHTTQIQKWGLTILDGIDELTLEADAVQITCRHRSLGRVVEFQGSARYDTVAEAMQYSLEPWFGTVLSQTGAWRDGKFTLKQSTPWFSGVQELQAALGSCVRSVC
jgi:hypothetical protein